MARPVIMDVEMRQRAFATNGNGELMALWSNVLTKQDMGQTACQAASGKAKRKKASSAINHSIILSSGSTVHLRERLVTMFPVYPHALRKGRITGGVTQQTLNLHGSTALLLAR